MINVLLFHARKKDVVLAERIVGKFFEDEKKVFDLETIRPDISLDDAYMVFGDKTAKVFQRLANGKYDKLCIYKLPEIRNLENKKENKEFINEAVEILKEKKSVNSNKISSIVLKLDNNEIIVSEEGHIKKEEYREMLEVLSKLNINSIQLKFKE
jgi:hypothetical protein